MAERRMIAKSIIGSAKFLKLSTAARELYFQLCGYADDDGIAEAFTLMRMIGASQSDLDELEKQDFVKILNDDLVTYIVDWLVHNKIRSDRKTDSVHQALLLKVIPDVQLIHPTQRSDRPPKQIVESDIYENQPP